MNALVAPYVAPYTVEPYSGDSPTTDPMLTIAPCAGLGESRRDRTGEAHGYHRVEVDDPRDLIRVLVYKSLDRSPRC